MAQGDTGAPAPTEHADEAEPVTERRGGFGSLGSIVYLLALTWAAGIASFPLSDNSFFTHLATGRIILEEGSVPSSDPYTFTAQGEPWTVQSWLASAAYAGFERLGGDIGLRVLVLAVFLAAISVLWRLTRPAESIIVRFLLVAGALFVATGLWSERPYMIGIIGLGVAWLALEGDVRPWLLVPMMWIWVNAHGSFPLALALCAAVVAGAALDRRGAGLPMSPTTVERKVVGAVALGTVLGAVGPIGPRILWFPLTAATKSDVFAEVIEWRPPAYQSVAERSFLVLVIITFVLLARRGSWRLVLPAAGFAAGALYAQRNVVMATVVLVAACAWSVPRLGTLRSTDRSTSSRILAVVLAALFVLVAAIGVLTPVDGFGGYPTRALAWTEGRELDGPTATEMPAGNLLEVLDGPTGRVFIDDRVDMFPVEVFDEFLTLRRGAPGWDVALDAHDIELVVWDRAQPLAALLASDRRWSVIYSDSGWIVACRRTTCGSP